MTHIKITRSEYFIYVKIVVALGILPFLFSVYFNIYNQFPHEAGVQPTFLIQCRGLAIFLHVIGIAIASAYILNLSEKRKGCKDHFWLTISIFFGITAFVCYIIWGLSKEYRFVLPKGHKLPSAKKVLLTTFKKDIKCD